MSQGEQVGISTARAKAERLVALLSPSCERIEIAGSIRRGKPLVADIELVAVPLVQEETGDDLWGTPRPVDRLDWTLRSLRASGALPLRDVKIQRADGRTEIGRHDGDSYKALVYDGFPVDLFIVRDPDQWGVIFTIRTGPADWSHRLVTDCQRFLRRVEGGYLYRSGQKVPCPEERDFFRLVGQPWVEPQDRRAELVSIQSAA